MLQRSDGSARRSRCVSLVVLLVLGLSVQACKPSAALKGGSSAITQRTATLNLGAGQSGQATALCQNGE